MILHGADAVVIPMAFDQTRQNSSDWFRLAIGSCLFAAFKCLGGDNQGKLLPSKEEDLERAKSIKVVTASIK